MPKRLVVAVVVAIALIRCSGTSPVAPSRGEEASGTSGFVHTTSHSADASPSPSPTPVNLPPVGQFRVHPIPDANGVISVGLGDNVKVNAAHFDDADGDQLKLRVDWGDGEQDAAVCGPCRFAHAYTTTGKFILKADISDGHLNDQSVRAQAKVDQTWTVQVNPFCHSINGGFSGACPTGATQFCEFVPIVATDASQAMDACNTCNGNRSGACFNVPRYAVWAFFLTGFQYAGQTAPCSGRSRAGDIIDPSCRVYGRWAP